MDVYQSTYTELRTRYISAWTPPPTEFSNEPFDNPIPATIWARFNVIDVDEKQISIGDITQEYRNSGILIVQLFAPLDQGIISILQTADTLANMFRGWGGNTVTCNEATIKKVGSNNNGWYQINVSIIYRVDTLH
jgi:hypothetical protein